MKKAFTLITLLLFIAAQSLTAQLTNYWIKTYDTQNHGADKAIAITYDNNCNVYVTGTSQGLSTGIDYLTIKYNIDGNVLWKKSYDGGASGGDDEPAAIAVDLNGNVYVTGKSQGTGTGYDYATICYNDTGGVRWAKRFNNTNTGGNGDDIAVALFVDALGQYVYVGGNSYNYVSSTSNNDFVIFKYDAATGIPSSTWGNNPVSFDEPSAPDDKLVAMVINSAGDVFVTGSSVNSGVPSSFWVAVKYNSSGSQVDVNYTVELAGVPTDIAIDGSNNVYILGNEGRFAIWALQASSIGLQLWHKYYSVQNLGINQNSGQFDYQPRKIKVNASGIYMRQYGY